MIYVRDFQTQNSEAFRDPRNGTDLQEMQEDAIEEERAHWEAERDQQKGEALNKLGKIAKNKFGNMSNMLRTFKKNTSDTITLPEFSEHLRRRKLDQQLPPEDQELIFEQLNASARGSIDAGLLSRTVDELSGITRHEAGDAHEMREFLEESIEAARKEKEAAKAHDGKQEKVIAGSADLMKKAIGQKSFGLDVGHEEMNDVVDDLFHKKHTQKSHGKFARYLRLTNMNLKTIPFYDIRTEQLDNMKRHAVNVHKLASSPSVAGRLAELQNKRRSRIEEDAMIHTRYFDEQDRLETEMMGHTGSTPISPVKTPADPVTASPLNALEGGLNSHDSSDNALFAATSYEDTAASALGGDFDASMFNSTYREYFPPLKYEPNMPVTRDNLSDADTRVKILNDRRRRRAARTKANLQITKDRLEMDELQALSRSLQRSKSVNEDQIRYQSTIFLNDLKCYKKQPLTRMARKPNLTKSDRMWGGQISFDSKNERDSRDFNTTFRESFTEPQGDGLPTLDIETKIRKMYAFQ